MYAIAFSFCSMAMAIAFDFISFYNVGGGCIWPLESLNEVARVAKSAGIATHMDGARLMNAVVKSGIEAARMVEMYDSVWLDFTKGLGAPVGAVLAGTQDFITQAWRFKQQMGGAMRQSGIVASMCLYALDHHVDRLAEDHELAERLGREIEALPKVKKLLPVYTNIIIFDVTDDAPTADEIVASLEDENIMIGAFGHRRIRVVTHIDVDSESGDALMGALKRHLGH